MASRMRHTEQGAIFDIVAGRRPDQGISGNREREAEEHDGTSDLVFV